MKKHTRVRQSRTVRVAIIGVGNCASSLVQGVEYYRHAAADTVIPGLMHAVLGRYGVGDVEFSAAFDIDVNKVGTDLGAAIFAAPNCTLKFADVPKLGVPVLRGMELDGIGKYVQPLVQKAPGDTVDVARVLRETRTDVVVNYLPVGSEDATKWYVEQILAAGCAMVNCIPVFIARGGHFAKRFRDAGLPIIGDDIKSQVGATIVHRTLAALMEARGIPVVRTYQLNFGGNTDFLNMLERDRLKSKKESKTNAVTSLIPRHMDPRNVHVGPSDHVPWLEDRKFAIIRLEGQGFGGAPTSIELKLEVWDSPNSAGVVIDAVRLAKIALDREIGGPLIEASAYLMKSPPQQMEDVAARAELERFIGPAVPRSAYVPAVARPVAKRSRKR